MAHGYSYRMFINADYQVIYCSWIPVSWTKAYSQVGGKVIIDPPLKLEALFGLVLFSCLIVEDPGLYTIEVLADVLLNIFWYHIPTNQLWCEILNFGN